MFVGMIIALNGAALIGVAYWATTSILQDEAFKRLVTIATLRQELLATTLERQEKQVSDFAGGLPLQPLLMRRVAGQMSPAQFRDEANGILSKATATITDYLAVWIEDDQGEVIASSGPSKLVSAFSITKRSNERSNGGLLAPPQRTDGTIGLPISAVVRDDDRKVLESVAVLFDFSQIASMLMDPTGLDDTGEVLVGVENGEAIQLITPTRDYSLVLPLGPNRLPAACRHWRQRAAANSGMNGRQTTEVRMCWSLTGRSAADSMAGD